MDKEQITQQLHALTRALNDHSRSLTASIAKDGWPRKMAHQGMKYHLRTWDPDVILETAQAECLKLGLPYDPSNPFYDKLTLSIWPKLPGAGVTPLLYGIALGFKHHAIRPSREGFHFAQQFQRLAQQYTSLNITVVDPEQPLEQRTEFREASVIVVSGSDDTTNTIQSLASEQQYVTGYHHRESLDIVQLSEERTTRRERNEIARRVAEDIVLWHQSGCFSARRLIVFSDCIAPPLICGLAEALAKAIADLESFWGATPTDPALLAQRQKDIQTAEILGEVWRAKFGWVSWGDFSHLIKTDNNILRRLTTPHTIEIEIACDLEEIKWPPAEHFQGVGVHIEQGNTWLRKALRETAVQHGATRLCQIGKLQRPPASWRHDGAPNITPWIPIIRKYSEGT